MEPRKAQLVLMALHLAARNVGRNYGVTYRDIAAPRRMTAEDLALLASQAGPPEGT
jgi:hypothetical protein